jgi:hypothetical protein
VRWTVAAPKQLPGRSWHFGEMATIQPGGCVTLRRQGGSIDSTRASSLSETGRLDPAPGQELIVPVFAFLCLDVDRSLLPNSLSLECEANAA